ncbi:MAG: Stk1 family PASTA domain-containing Ser/Thr kinase [Eubacteriales bacterium]|nr:Stk1 family PASTA domain-containing Ser/Thr kinase [Eubacteriales bacterium]
MLRKGMFIADRYEILEQIGAGGMSDVYKAKCHKLNRFVAIKVMKNEFSEDKTFVTKFRAEAQSAAGLTHPNIVNVYDVGDENGIYYIVMELVEGITLKKYIEKRGRIPYKEAVSIAIQVANGMEAAHSHHIIHRDIKPQNIIISKDGKVKVTDFGIAKAATSSTINSAAMGSVHYISPEQARGGYSDERSDIYSFGITLFEMITGTVPFDGDSTVSVAVQHIQDEIPAPSTVAEDIPVSVDKIVLKCTQKKTDRRYLNVAELIVDLKKSLVMPDVDFVKMAPVYGTADSSEKLQKNEGFDGDSLLDDEDDTDDVFSDDDTDEYDAEDGTDIDDESNDKLDKAVKWIGIGIVAVILIVTIFIVVKLVGGSSSKPENNTTTVESTTKSHTTGTTAGDRTAVPDVKGMTKEDAIKELNKAGLGYREVAQASDTVAEGCVISQGTAAGTQVAKNTQIILTISSGKDSVDVTVPNVNGKSESEARTELEALNLNVGVDYEYSESVAQGNVIRYSPAGKTTEGSTVTIIVSRGPDIRNNVTMINMVGYTDSAAETWLNSNGLIPDIQYDYPGGKKGNVAAQGYAPGASLAKGTVVTIHIYLGETQQPTTAPVIEPTTPVTNSSNNAAQ